jgi:DNA-binding XRE family transcriptional regulator
MSDDPRQRTLEACSGCGRRAPRADPAPPRAPKAALILLNSTRDNRVSGEAMALRDARLRKLLTQRQLAERAGVTQATIVRIERGEPAYPSTLRKLARALGVEPETFSDLVRPRER